MPCSRAH